LRIELVTIFPRMLEGPLSDGIVQRARDAGLLEIRVHDLREFSDDRHRSVDDAPFGGGPGMVM
jgi:tRNA (guanine37-N1)-methyltransferase